MEGIAYWIEKRRYITPNRVALIGENRSLSYKEMADELDLVANLLIKKYGIKKGDRIAILAGNRIEYLLLLFSIAKIGSIAVPLNIRLTLKELEYQVKDSQTKTLIVSDEFYESGNILSQATNIQHLISLEDIFKKINHEDNLNSITNIKDSVDGSTPFLIIYTSGTTGKPKGAVLTQENMYWNSVNNTLALDLNSDDRVLTILPLFHIGGIGLFALPALFVGGTVIIPNRFDPDQSLELIEKEQVTIFMGVPTIFDALRKSERFPKTDFRTIKWFYSGGAPCPHEIINFYIERGIRFGQGFGMTETSPTVFMIDKDDYYKKIGSIGKPVMFVDIRIVDEDGNDLQANEVGELIFKGPNILKEYWNLPNETAKSFKDGWFYSGDLAKRDEDGFIYIAGRKKDMIISGGENIYPLEVEQVIMEIEEISEVAVIGVNDNKWGEVPLAVVAVKKGRELEKNQILAHCLERLAKYKCPKHIEYVEELPKNATGKIDKALIKKHYADFWG